MDYVEETAEPKGTTVNYRHNIPDELRDRIQWVCWKYEQRDGRTTKIPKNPSTGRNANTADTTTWGTFDEAVAAAERHNFDGIGFVFTKDDPYVGIDIDDCLAADSCIPPELQKTIDFFRCSYCEISPSGKGVKLIVRGSLPTENTGRKTRDFEAYQYGRFFTITGNCPFGVSTPIQDCSDLLQGWYAKVFPQDEDSDIAVFATVDCRVSSDEIIKKAKADDPRFDELFAGDQSSCDNDHSSADLAFCIRIAHWTGPDPVRIDEVFRESELCREKWERADYRRRTIQKAITSAAKGGGFHDWRPTEEVFFDVIAWTESEGFWSSVTAESRPANDVVSTVSVSPVPWNEPLELRLTDPPKICSDDLHPVIRDFACAVSAFTETPLELAALAQLGVLATCCQGKCVVQGPNGYTEPLCLWTCTVLGSGNRKSEVLRLVAAPLRTWEKNMQTTMDPVRREAESRRKTVEKQIDHLRKESAKKTGDDVGVWQQQIATMESEMSVVPSFPRLVSDDCTPEKIAILMQENGERMSVISDEAGIFDIMGGRYSRGVPALDLYLQSHSGTPVTVDRVSRESILLAEPCLSLVVTVQPLVLRNMVSNSTFAGRGLLARHLFAVPVSTIGYRRHSEEPLSTEAILRWKAAVDAMLDFGEDSRDAPSPALVLSSDAAKLYRDETQQNEVEMRPEGRWGEDVAWPAKYMGAILRTAGIFHIAEQVTKGCAPIDVHISGETMRFAIRLLRKIKEHSYFALMQFDRKTGGRLTVKIANWICEHPAANQFRRRDVQRELCGGRMCEDLDGALNVLVEHNWIRPLVIKPAGPPSKTQFEVNPHVTRSGQNADIADSTR
jgi:Protein of unknown function (DUF3987)/NrS-1  polymerase HBD domain